MTVKIPEVEEAIAYIHRNLEEPISLDGLAKYVGYSTYHFLRLFKAQTGLPPHYYVSSLRLQKAKDLLLHTNFTVRDIAQEIGQQSLGTFTTRFTEKVGVTPAAFRAQRQQAERQLQQLMALKEREEAGEVQPDGAKISGHIQAEGSMQGVIFVGLFHRPIPDSIPVYGTLLLRPGPFRFAGVRPGTYYLMATSLPWCVRSEDILLPQHTLRTRMHPPIVIESHDQHIHLQVTLHPPSLLDPPILISLPLLMSRFLARQNA